MVTCNINNLSNKEMAKKRTLNELRQTKEVYDHPYEPVVNGLRYLCYKQGKTSKKKQPIAK